MTRYLDEIRRRLLQFKIAIVEGILRGENTIAGSLERLETGEFANPEPHTYLSHFDTLSVQPYPASTKEMLLLSNGPNWMIPHPLYILEGVQPQDPKVARTLRAQAAHYFVINGDHYRRSYLAPLLKCLDCPESEYCMLEVHEGICGCHLLGEALAHGTTGPISKKTATTMSRIMPNANDFLPCLDSLRRSPCPFCSLFLLTHGPWILWDPSS